MKPSIQASKAPASYFTPSPFGKFFQVQKFPNGYEASIIHHARSYGANFGLFEAAVRESATGKIVYDTPVTSDVLGFLTFREVADMLDAIAEL